MEIKDQNQQGRFIIHIDPDLKELVQEFLENITKNIYLLNNALIIHDFATIQSLAHKMIGSGGSYGFNKITEIAGLMEQSAINQNVKEISNLLSELSLYLKNIKVVYE